MPEKKKLEAALKWILKHEGGLVCHKDDPGGWTNFGISLRWLQSIPIEDADIDGDGVVDYEDIQELTVEDAKRLYTKYWWDKYRYNLILDTAVSIKVFDMAVNMGPYRAATLVQTAIRALGYDLGRVDGKLGKLSFTAINTAVCDLGRDHVLRAIRGEQIQFYKRLAVKNERFTVFLRGWLNRANDEWQEKDNGDNPDDPD